MLGSPEISGTVGQNSRPAVGQSANRGVKHTHTHTWGHRGVRGGQSTMDTSLNMLYTDN